MRMTEKDDSYVAHVTEACHDAFRHLFDLNILQLQRESQLKGLTSLSFFVNQGVSDASRDVDSKETHDRVQEGENKVFSAFGYFHKIATFEKVAGFQWKFAHVAFSKPEYLQDSDIVMNRFHVRYVFLLAKESFRKNIHCNIEGWEQHLGLEHTATTPKMSYLGNNQMNRI
ncbi:hypothetical protein ZEAMMB73_Zm00001d025297 [Zea mays]|uniref:Uncharacterized protein n=1 Tax=Zea mays TaxID=4577 RepID=A0A1D6J6C1_MAIZE|nr:hypothetical protein ZEAMMB73_Zm00001d025297 [Zea mays]